MTPPIPTADKIPGGYVARYAHGHRATEAGATRAVVPGRGAMRAGFAVNIPKLPGIAAPAE